LRALVESCDDHSGGIRGHVELHKAEGEGFWIAHAWVVGQEKPEGIVMCKDPDRASNFAAELMADAAEEVDEILPEVFDWEEEGE
jgi:hypothetical protein